MRVICISGKARHGKDTAAGFLRTLLEGNGEKVLVIHYADYLKFICQNCYGWDGKKDEAGRTLLQYIGTDLVRTRDPGFWVRILSETLAVLDGEWDTVIIPDCRFPNEVFGLIGAGFDTTHVRVVRPHYYSEMTAAQMAHPSETAMDGVVPDGVIVNDGTLKDLGDAVTNWYYDTFYTQEELL